MYLKDLNDILLYDNVIFARFFEKFIFLVKTALIRESETTSIAERDNS